ncbi:MULTISPECIES: hypothetical protein [unclassified Saccharothrix]|uniref:hypothetical protein n=1 Tax=unclassified Saccharothrix TaxID=2593673 RepID=UPI00307EC9BC
MTDLDDDAVTAIANDQDDAVRSYLVAHRRSPYGMQAATTFLRFVVDDHTLFVECDRTVLPPLLRELRMQERTSDRFGFRDFTDAEVLTSSVGWIGTFFSAPFRLIHSLSLKARTNLSHRREARVVRRALLHDYGVDVTIRELAASGPFDNSLQLTDLDRDLKVVERHVLEALIAFLDDRGVDSSELHSRQTAILNQGVIQTGGTSNIGALAVGDRAKASTRDDQERTTR